MEIFVKFHRKENFIAVTKISHYSMYYEFWQNGRYGMIHKYYLVHQCRLNLWMPPWITEWLWIVNGNSGPSIESWWNDTNSVVLWILNLSFPPTTQSVFFWFKITLEALALCSSIMIFFFGCPIKRLKIMLDYLDFSCCAYYTKVSFELYITFRVVCWESSPHIFGEFDGLAIIVLTYHITFSEISFVIWINYTPSTNEWFFFQKSSN